MSRDWSRRGALGAKADHTIEQALKHELRAAGTPDRDACVDAETIGAWADGGLDATEMSAVELHVSVCARCQAIVGAVTRSEPTISPVSAPLTGAPAFRFPRWALAPLAAAAAVTLWMVVPQDPMQAPPAPAQAPVEARNDSVPPARNADLAAQPQERAIAPEASPPAAVAETFAASKRERANAPPELQDRQQRAEERAGAALGAAAPPAPAPPALAEPVQLQRNANLSAAPLEIVSPDPSSRWRIVNNAIERSEDGGASWMSIRAPGGESITGGASPARSVCWLIGSSGLVMVTTDGVTFARVPLPERVDLTTITATDASRATVTTADGRQFHTNDSGRNWRQN